MMTRAPFADPLLEAGQLSEEPLPEGLPRAKSRPSFPRSSFQWPADCHWPFADQGDDGNA
jgi:hypothetical protein